MRMDIKVVDQYYAPEIGTIFCVHHLAIQQLNLWNFTFGLYTVWTLIREKLQLAIRSQNKLKPAKQVQVTCNDQGTCLYSR